MENKFKIRELRKLPFRKWDKIEQYQSLLVINSGKKHDSGFALMYIIGIVGGEPKEIVASCDDINWYIPQTNYSKLRTDMYYPSGIIHFWSNDFDFEVGPSLSSTDIELIKIKNEK